MEDWKAQRDEGDIDAEEPFMPESFSFWRMIRRLFIQTAGEKAAEQQQRIGQLSAAISDHPQGAANYLLRGELRLEHRQYELAHEDFLKALELAETQFEQERWGIASQSIMDRARVGLQHVQRYID